MTRHQTTAHALSISLKSIAVVFVIGLGCALVGDAPHPACGSEVASDPPSRMALLTELQRLREQLGRLERLLALESELAQGNKSGSVDRVQPLVAFGLRIVQNAPLARLTDGMTVPLGNGEHIFVDVPDEVNGRSYLQRNGYQGKLQFDVLESQTVFMAMYGQDWGGGGNPSGDWQHEVLTPEQLEDAGWHQIALLSVKHSTQDAPQAPWILYCRNCKAGESFLIRNHKYQAPLLIWGSQVLTDVRH